MVATPQQLAIAPLHTLTATETNQPYIVLPGPVSGVTVYNFAFVRVQYYGALLTSGSGTLTFISQVSYNRGSSWVTNSASAATSPAIALTTTAQSGEVTLQVSPNLPTDVGQIWLMILAQIAGSPTGPIVSYRADLLQS